VRAFDFGYRVLQIGDGWQPVQAITDAVVLARGPACSSFSTVGNSIVDARKTGVFTAPRNFSGARPR
jgi:hypothetical protein